MIARWGCGPGEEGWADQERRRLESERREWFLLWASFVGGAVILTLLALWGNG